MFTLPSYIPAPSPPSPAQRYADKVSVISLDFWGLLSQSCWFQPDFLKQLVFTTLLPLGIVSVLMAQYAKTVRCGTERREGARSCVRPPL